DGVGKNEVVKQIVQCFKARAHGKTVGVICSSGIACQVYDHGSALTFHFFSYQSINSGATLAIKALDVVIWDEARTLRRRMFEVVNFLHHELATYNSPLFDLSIPHRFGLT
ncbi:hypothetical protein pdam_00012156, partial [Pocillopora damicornis]